MPDERLRHHVESPPPDDDSIVRPDPLDQFIGWAAKLPLWAIILASIVFIVAYLMLSSAAYRRVIRQLTDNPQVSTNDLYNVVQIVGEPTTVTGTYQGQTFDSVSIVLDELLTTSADGDPVPGFVGPDLRPVLTVQTDDGPVTVVKADITAQEPADPAVGEEITITYTNRVTVAGVMTDEDKHTMTVRTVDEVSETFAANRVLERTDEEIPCAVSAGPECEPRVVTTIQREGEILTGTLVTLNNTSISFKVDGDEREERRSVIEYYYVPTLTLLANQDLLRAAVVPGAEVRVGYVSGTSPTDVLAQLDALDDIGVALNFTEGEAQVVLVPYADLAAGLDATAAGEVSSLMYLDAGPERFAAADWVEQNPDAGVVLIDEPRECNKDCAITLKLIDDEVVGRVAEETGGEIKMITTEAQFVVIDKSLIVENRRKEPGVCALNNLRGCDSGIFLTLRVTFMAYFLALAIGLVFGLLRVQTNPVLYAIATLYVEVIRGIPLLVILLYAGFVISPELRDTFGLNLSDEQEAIIGLAFGYGAFIAEIFRAGIQSISRGQMEAARSLGMSYPQAMRHVVLPQAIRVVLPPLGNDFIAMLKDSALISVLALPDLLQLGRLYVSRTFRAFEGYNTVAVLYLVMTIFLSMLVRIIERRSRLPG